MNNYNHGSNYVAGVPQQSGYNTSYDQQAQYVAGVPQQNGQLTNNYSVNPSFNSNQMPTYPVLSSSSVGFNVPYGSPSVPTGGYDLPTSQYGVCNLPPYGVGYAAPPFVPGGGYGLPPSVPGGGYGPPSVPGGGCGPPSVPGGGYGPPSVPGGGYGPPSVPGGGYGPPSVPGGGYGPTPSASGGGYGPPSFPSASGYSTPDNCMATGANSGSIPSAPIASHDNVYVNDTTQATINRDQMSDINSINVNNQSNTVPRAAPRATIGVASNKSSDYQTGLDKLAALMNDDVKLTDEKLKSDRQKYNLNN